MEKLADRLHRFERDASAYLPGLLTVCDLADAKRRNDHLGCTSVDNDIQEFDQLITTWVGSDGISSRVKGNTWLAINKSDSLPSLTAFLCAYRKHEAIEVGWQSKGKKDSATKLAKRTSSAEIIRAIRCIYTRVTNQQELHTLVEALLDQCYGFEPDEPIELSEATKFKRSALSNWSCVTSYPSESPFCPFCQSKQFEWEDGDGSIYSGSGTCKNCGADIDIRGVEILANSNR